MFLCFLFSFCDEQCWAVLQISGHLSGFSIVLFHFGSTSIDYLVRPTATYSLLFFVCSFVKLLVLCCLSLPTVNPR